jgi:hypothetical protein
MVMVEATAEEDSALDELAVLLPTPKTLDINGTVVDVSPLKLGEIVKVVKPLKVLKSYFKDGAAFQTVALDLLSSNDAEKVLDVLAVLVRQPRAFIDDLGIDDAVTVLAAVIANNMDVFQKKVLPAIQILAEQTTASLSAT